MQATKFNTRGNKQPVNTKKLEIGRPKESENSWRRHTDTIVGKCKEETENETEWTTEKLKFTIILHGMHKRMHNIYLLLWLKYIKMEKQWKR